MSLKNDDYFIKQLKNFEAWDEANIIEMLVICIPSWERDNAMEFLESNYNAELVARKENEL